ncbi:MAG: MotA/TolQ/ExbB proton channel family protein [Planctomycetota bacterium]
MHSRLSRALLLSLPLQAALLPSLSAAEGEGGLGTAKATYWEIFSHGKEINILLACLAFLALFLFFHVLMITRRRLTVPGALLQALLDDIASGDIEQGCRRAGESRSLLGQVVLPALKLHDHPLERLHQVTEGAGRRAVGALRQRVTYLANIGAICPMIGLLGTVMGMMTAFASHGMELDVAMKQKMLTAAIGQAMTTTAVGLIVGIPAMAFYYYAIGRVNRIADELEMAAENVIACMQEIR